MIDLDNWIPELNLGSLRDKTTVYCTMSGCRLTQVAHLKLVHEVQDLLELHVRCKHNSHVNTNSDNSIFSIEDSDSLEDNSSRKLFTLTEIPFTRLSKLTSPLCALLEGENLTTDLRSCPTGSRISHKYNKNTHTTNGASYTNVHLQQFGRDVQSLIHLRVHSSCQQEFKVSANAGSNKRTIICNPDGSLLLESIPQFKNLQTLVLSEIKFDFTNVHHFPAIFTSCVNIEELHCQRLLLGNHLKFCKDLSTGLHRAAKLRILKLQQCGISQYYPFLLEGLQSGSKKLEQLVIITPSDLGLTKKVKFPIKQTVDLVKSCSKLFLIYVCSEALVKNNVKELRTEMKMIKEERKNLVYCFHKPEKSPPYYRFDILIHLRLKSYFITHIEKKTK